MLFLGVFLSCKATSVFASTLVMSITSNYAPYHFFSENKLPRGVHFDILKEITTKHGHQLKMVEIPRKRMESRIISGKEDVFPNAIEWTKNIDDLVYSEPITRVQDILFLDAKSSINFQSPEDLLGKTIVVISGYHYPMLDSYFTEGKITRLDAVHEYAALSILQKKRADGAIVVNAIGQWLIQKHKWDNLYTRAPKTVTDTNFRFIFNKKWAKFIPIVNAELRAMRANGRIDAISKTYGFNN